MPVARQEIRPAAPARRIAPPAARAAAHASPAVARVRAPAPATAATPLAATLARAVSERPPAPHPWTRPATALLQREAVEDGWLGSTFDAAADLIGVAAQKIEDAVTNVAGAVQQRADEALGYVLDAIGDVSDGIRDSPTPPAAKAHAVAQLITYPKADAGAYARPDGQAWLQSAGLSAVRGGTLLLRRGSTSKDPGTLGLMKQALQAWGSDALGLDILPTGGSGGPFGPETEAAVKKFQLCSGAAADGIVGPQTMKRLDDFVLG